SHQRERDTRQSLVSAGPIRPRAPGPAAGRGPPFASRHQRCGSCAPRRIASNAPTDAGRGADPGRGGRAAKMSLLAIVLCGAGLVDTGSPARAGSMPGLLFRATASMPLALGVSLSRVAARLL